MITTVDLKMVKIFKQQWDKENISGILGYDVKQYDEQMFIDLEEYWREFVPCSIAHGRTPRTLIWAVTFGVILGEAIIENFGGKWTMAENQGRKPYKEAAVKNAGGTWFPITKARKFITLDDQSEDLVTMFAIARCVRLHPGVF